jgi:hypothetical protein
MASETRPALSPAFRAKYELDSVLGAGGFGQVYRARQIELNRPVAIKFLADQAGLGDEVFARFELEGQVQARMRHPNLVTIYECGQSQGVPYIVFELIDGPALSRVIGRGPLALGRALAIAAGLCDGLHYAHELGVIHRDIKPGNILLAGNSEPKLTDFGMAIAGQARSFKTTAGTFLGTPSYVAPEIITGSWATAASDLYAAATVLFEMIAGAPPFAGSIADTLDGHLHGQLVLPALPQERWAGELAALLRAGLAKDPAARPSSAAAMATKARRLAEEVEAAGQTEFTLPRRKRGASGVLSTNTRESPTLGRSQASSRAVTRVVNQSRSRGVEASALATARAPAAPLKLAGWFAAGLLTVLMAAGAAWGVRTWRSAEAQGPRPVDAAYAVRVLPGVTAALLELPPERQAEPVGVEVRTAGSLWRRAETVPSGDGARLLVNGLKPGASHEVRLLLPGGAEGPVAAFSTPEKLDFLDVRTAYPDGGTVRLDWSTNVPARAAPDSPLSTRHQLVVKETAAGPKAMLVSLQPVEGPPAVTRTFRVATPLAACATLLDAARSLEPGPLMERFRAGRPSAAGMTRALAALPTWRALADDWKTLRPAIEAALRPGLLPLDRQFALLDAMQPLADVDTVMADAREAPIFDAAGASSPFLSVSFLPPGEFDRSRKRLLAATAVPPAAGRTSTIAVSSLADDRAVFEVEGLELPGARLYQVVSGSPPRSELTGEFELPSEALSTARSARAWIAVANLEPPAYFVIRLGERLRLPIRTTRKIFDGVEMAEEKRFRVAVASFPVSALKAGTNSYSVVLKCPAGTRPQHVSGCPWIFLELQP